MMQAVQWGGDFYFGFVEGPGRQRVNSHSS